MSKAADIKDKIEAKLNELKVSNVLGTVMVDDFKKAIFDRDFSAYPVAVLTPPSIGGDYFTNSQNLRTYTFEVLVISKGENIAADGTIENLAEAILDKFDNIPTAEGVADGGLDPSSTPVEAVLSKDGTLLVFSVILRAKAVKDISLGV